MSKKQTILFFITLVLCIIVMSFLGITTNYRYITDPNSVSFLEYMAYPILQLILVFSFLYYFYLKDKNTVKEDLPYHPMFEIVINNIGIFLLFAFLSILFLP